MQAIYVVSLPGSPRRESIAKALDAHGVAFSFEDAVDARELAVRELEQLYDEAAVVARYGRSMTAAEVACFLSHRAVWTRIAESGYGAIVLEDDALLDRPFFDHVLDWNQHAVSKAADIVLLGRSKVARSVSKYIAIHEPLKSWMTVDTLRIGFPFKQWTSGAVGYWISASAARRMILETSNRIAALLDDWPFHRDSLGLRIAEVRPYVVWEAFETMPSSIEAGRRAVSIKRGRLRNALLQPFRMARTCLRWLRILGRASTGRTNACVGRNDSA